VNENVKLADCWKSEQVVIVACEPTGAHLSDTSLLSIDILSPTSNHVWGSKPRERHPTRQVCHRDIIALEKSKENNMWIQPTPCHRVYDCRQQFRLQREQAVAKARKMFSELCEQYVSICLVSHDLRDSLSALENFGVQLPSSTVYVDLVKVLEHQCRQSGKGPPEELRQYTDENLAVRNGRYDRRPWPLTGWLGMPNLALLEVLGPAAESHRRDKTEKRDAAMKRIVRRMVVGEIPVRNKGRS
jgi:hypothetical protein